MLTLTDEQAAAVERMAQEPTKAALNISDTGTGKTLCAVELAKALNAQTILVVAPKKTLKQWAKTFEGQGVTLPQHVITTVEQFNLLKSKEPGVYLVGREMYYLGATSTDIDPETGRQARKAKWNWLKTRPDLHIVDESHSATNRWGLMFSTLEYHPSEYRLALSATAQGSKFDGIWAVCRWLWPTVESLWPKTPQGKISRSKNLWEAEWCEKERNVIGRDKNGDLKWVTKVVGEKEPGKWISILPCVIALEADRVPYELYEVPCPLGKEQREVWDEMAKKSIAWLQNNPTVAKLPVERRMRLRQMALALPYIDEEGTVNFEDDAPSVKLEKARKIQARHPDEKILFVVDSAKFARIAAKRLGAALYSGDIPEKKRNQIKEEFSAEGGLQYMVATYQSVSEGLDGIQFNCHIEVQFNVVDSPVLSTQFDGRLNRNGQRAEKIVRYLLIAPDTIDDENYLALMEKRQLRRKELTL